MQAPTTSSSLLRPVSPDAAASVAEVQMPSPCDTLAGAVDSSALLQGQKAVAISHNGSVYRLQATKLGKLILTK